MPAFLPRALCSLALALALASPAQASPQKKAAKLADKAEHAMADKGDPGRAVDLASRALELDPRQPKALGVMALTHFVVAGMVGGADAQMLLGEGQRYLNVLMQVDPSSPYIEWCLNAASGLLVSPLLPEPVVDCPAEAVARFDAAEERFARGDIGGAAPLYEEALAQCPAAPKWWTYYGDTYFSKGDYVQARAQYARALEASPCYWPALRFTADAYLKEGDLERAHDYAVAAVACNPDYGMGWSYLASVQESRGQPLSWLDVQKPPLPQEGEALSVSVDGGGPFGGTAGLVWGLARLNQDPGAPADPLGRERAATRAVIEMLRGGDGAALQAPDMALWRLLAEADAAGMLDEAILVLLLDEALVPQLLEMQAQEPTRIPTFIDRFLAP